MFDITFIGHMCYDEITPYRGETKITPGSAVLCGSMVAGRLGKKVAAVVKMSEKDRHILEPMEKAGVVTYLIPSAQTTYSRVIYPTADVDIRRLILEKSAGIIKIGEIPRIATNYVHLAGISDTEFDMELMTELRNRGYDLSVDMQSFVRQVNPMTKEIAFKDVAYKKEIAGMMNKIKMDKVEAQVLTGTDDLEKAAEIFESWGCPETMVTQAEGVLVRAEGRTYYEKFSNRSDIGRTGRGDTTFAAYLSRRIDHTIAESLKFAAALVSIKMETAGPFNGTLEEVLQRVEQKHSK